MSLKENLRRMRRASVPPQSSHGGLGVIARRGRALLAAICVAAAAMTALTAATGQAAGVRQAHHGHSVNSKHAKRVKHAKHVKHVKHSKRSKHPKHHAKPAPRPGLPGTPPGKPGTQPGKPGPPPAQPPSKPIALQPGTLGSGNYTNSGGTLNYELYVPSGYKAGTAVPLVVALHGCTQTGDVFRQLSGWDKLAEAKGFIVAFPTQSTSRNAQSCWNWFTLSDAQRGAAETTMIAGLASSIASTYSVDHHRIYVAGFSAGAAMATVMGATYPDVFAAVGTGSGCEYNGLPCVGYQGPDPTQTGQQAYAAMGKYARVVPVIVFQGDNDQVVAPANAPEIVREWQITDGDAAGSPMPTNPMSSSFGFSPGGGYYTLTTYPDAHGNSLIEYWDVHGMGHAWSGGSATQQYSYPAGPDETAAMYAFFMAHPAP